MNKFLLHGENLSCSRNERLLWKNLAFDLSKGELLQIVGENGAGKTTFLRAVCGLLPLMSGKIYWQNQLITECKSEFQQAIYFLGHQLGIKEELTVRENLYFHLKSFPRLPDKAKLEWAFSEMHILEWQHHLGRQLSQGQRQRVALTQLLLSPTQLWILDEPFAALDEEVADKITHIFIQHLAKGGSILCTTHRPVASPLLPIRYLSLASYQ